MSKIEQTQIAFWYSQFARFGVFGCAYGNRSQGAMRDREAEMDNDTIVVVDANAHHPVGSERVRLRDGDHDRTRSLTHLLHDFKGPRPAALWFCSLLLDDAVSAST